MKIIIEFLILFIILYTLYYLFIIKKCKKKKKNAPIEVNIILFLHQIDAKKINLYQMIKVVGFTTVGILSFVITLVFNVFKNSTILSIIIGSIVSIIMALICYTIIGNYYERVSRKNDLHKKK